MAEQTHHPLPLDASAEETYRRIFDRAADAIFIHNKTDHRFLDCNNTAIERYGYSLEEIRMMTPYDLHPPEEFDMVAEQISVRNVDAPNFYMHMTREGRVFPVEILSEEVEYKGIPAWASIARDISERRRAAEEIAASRDEAIAASKAKSDFVAGVSHELRTPMNGIMGMVALLLETELTEEQREYAQTITSAADSMLELVNEILDLSKIESGKLELEPIPFDLQENISSVVSLLLPRANQGDIDLVVDFAPEVPTNVIGDPTRIRQVITNLTGNAIKFTSDGQVTIRVSGHVENSQAQLRIAVEDTGIGIAPDRLEAIFEEFSQADISTTRNYGGTGLGLAISRRLVGMMGGQLQVESTEGEGSTFWFEVNLPVPAGEESPESGRILVVHPESTQRRELQNTLLEMNLPSVAVATSAEALDRVAAAPHELDTIVLNYVLPDLDGETLGRSLKSRAPHLRLFLLQPPGVTIPASRLDRAGFSGALEATPDPQALESFLTAEVEPEVTDVDESKLRVLVVEDNPVNQKVVMHVLRRMDCDVSLAENGVQAVDRVRESPRFHLILMDCQMPEMDGYEATRRIRTLDPELAATPIVALTANAMEGDREKCLAAGMDDYMSKPATRAQIGEMLEKWTSRLLEPVLS